MNKKEFKQKRKAILKVSSRIKNGKPESVEEILKLNKDKRKKYKKKLTPTELSFLAKEYYEKMIKVTKSPNAIIDISTGEISNPYEEIKLMVLTLEGPKELSFKECLNHIEKQDATGKFLIKAHKRFLEEIEKWIDEVDD